MKQMKRGPIRTEADRDRLIEQCQREYAVRRLCQLVVVGELTMVDVRRALGASYGSDDSVVEAILLTTETRHEKGIEAERGGYRAHGIIEIDEDGWWKAMAGNIRSDGHCFDNPRDGLDWLYERVADTQDPSENPVFLDVSVAVGAVRCESEQPLDEVGFCAWCRAYDAAESAEMSKLAGFNEALKVRLGLAEMGRQLSEAAGEFA